MRDLGRPEDPSPVKSEGAGGGDTRSLHREATLEERGDGATQSLNPGPLKDERDEATPILRRRHSLRTQKSGQPGIWLGRLKGMMMV